MTIPSTPASVVCTLFEKDYHLGLAALANSLHGQGFRGTLFAGVRGPLPPWAQPLVPAPHGQGFVVAEDFLICFVPVKTERHLTYYKPHFLLDVLRRLAPEAPSAIYFDPDITIKAPWSFFSHWTEDHIALCEDLNWRFDRSHPIRREWARILQPQGIVPSGTVDVYCNAGFVGVARRHMEFLEKWEDILQIIDEQVENCRLLTIADRSFAFHKGDQDAMNMAVDCFPQALSLIGPEGMDFIHGGYTMSHAVGNLKPWTKNFILSALSGTPPTPADKGFTAHSEGPIPIFDAFTRAVRKIDLRFGSALGRFIRRF